MQDTKDPKDIREKRETREVQEKMSEQEVQQLKNAIKSNLIRLSVDPTHLGFKQLVECISVRIRYEMNTLCKIYAEVSKDYGVQPKTVMRNVTYALRHAYDLPQRLSEVLGFPIDVNTLHAGKVIFYMADYVTDPSLFDFDK